MESCCGSLFICEVPRTIETSWYMISLCVVEQQLGVQSLSLEFACVALVRVDYCAQKQAALQWIAKQSMQSVNALGTAAAHLSSRLQGISGKSKSEPCRGGQTTQKGNKYLGDVWTSEPEQVLTLSLIKYH